MWGEVCGSAGGRRRATAVQAACRAGLDCRFGAGRGEERTLNMLPMSVTLEVSKLSGWLNAFAPCRGSKGGHIRCGVRYAGRQAGGAAGDRGGHAACRAEGSTADMGEGEERT